MTFVRLFNARHIVRLFSARQPRAELLLIKGSQTAASPGACNYRRRVVQGVLLAGRAVLPGLLKFCRERAADRVPAPQGAGGAGRAAPDREDRVLPHRQPLPFHSEDLLRLLQVPAAHHPGGLQIPIKGFKNPKTRVRVSVSVRVRFTLEPLNPVRKCFTFPRGLLLPTKAPCQCVCTGVGGPDCVWRTQAVHAR